MRFRHKVIMMNIAFLSTALGILGFIIIFRNFNQALDVQTSYAVKENNLFQTSIQYRLLDVINAKEPDLPTTLSEVGGEIENSLLSQLSFFYILYNDQLVYSNADLKDSPIPETLLTTLQLNSKNYLIKQEQGHHYIYVISRNIIDDTSLFIITKRNADDTYQLLSNQIGYFFTLMLVVLVICSVFMYFLSRHLTNPIEELNTITDYFAQGNYDVRANISSNDEISLLAEKFNNMALSVSEHIEELNLMVKQHEQFVADFTHEIKTPMTTIIGYADTLRSKELSDERKALAYQYIYSEGKRLELMSMKLFDLIYLKEHSITKSELSTTLLIEQVSASVTPGLTRKKIALKIDIAPATIFGDEELLKTVFINLIDNARKASNKDSEIVVRGFCQQEDYVFQVKDSGCGMDQETINHICDEFYMADKSRSRQEGGAGLGMSLVAIILQKHNTSMAIESEPGAGTTVSITFHMTHAEMGVEQ